MSALEDFLNRYTGNTAAAYRRDFADWAEWAALHEIETYSPARADVQSYVRALEAQDKSAATISRRLATLSSFFNYAISEGLATGNPVALVRRPKISEESSTRGLSNVELRAFLDTAREQGPAEYAFCAFLVTTATRVSSAVNLHTDDLATIDGHRTARVVAKGGKEKLLVLAGAAAAIDSYLDGRTGQVFLRPDGNPFTRDSAFHLIRRIARLAGISNWESVTPHAIRATSISVALDNGTPLHIVQDFAGHTESRVTQGYNKRRFQLAKSPAHSLSGLLAI